MNYRNILVLIKGNSKLIKQIVVYKRERERIRIVIYTKGGGRVLNR